MSEDIEVNRYNNFSIERMKEGPTAKTVPQDLSTPYIELYDLIRTHANSNSKVLDLCCGDGIHSVVVAQNTRNLVAMDLSGKSIELAKFLYEDSKIEFCVGNAVSTGFPDATFDLVYMVGSLSYVDHVELLAEVRRILKSSGTFIILDSNNSNPFYRLNRFIHFLKGNRSMSTLKRMPTIKKILRVSSEWDVKKVHNYGIFVFMLPVMKLFISKAEKRKLILDRLDKYFLFAKKFSFKFIIILKKNDK